MSIRQSVSHEVNPAFKVSFYCIKSVFIFFILCLKLSSPSLSAGEETIILNIILNQEPKGEFFVKQTDDGDFLVRTADLKDMGFKEPTGKITEIEGEIYLSLKSIEGVGFAPDEKTATLEITASPILLSKRELDFLPQRPPEVYYPKDSSVFLNYGFYYNAIDSLKFQSFNATNQFGVRLGDFLLLSDSSYTRTETDENFVRLMSNITYDRRKEMQRFIAGDFFAFSGDLGSSINIGGISFSKTYRIDPYFIKYPTIDFTGLLSLPSDVEIYLDGTLLKRERLSPGEFELKNISQYTGASILEIVIRDSFGREQRLRYPFYFTDILLRKGLHDYSYNVGFLREEFGVESNRYTNLAFSAFHRYGISDSFTIGFRAEGGKGNYNLGPQASYLIPNAGVITLSLSGSRDDDREYGYAGSLNYEYWGRKISTRLLLKGYSEDYSTILSEPSDEKIKYEAAAGVGFGTKDFGSLSLDFTTIKKYQGQNSETYRATYLRPLTKNSTIFTTFKRIREKESSDEFLVGIIYYFGRYTSLSTSYQRSEDTTTEVVQLQKNPPVGEGFGYRALYERTCDKDRSMNTINPFLQYNSRFGIYTGEYKAHSINDKTSETYQVTASGGIAYVGNTIGLSRPIYDSFGVVKVGNVEGVRVYHENQEIGRTDSSGRVFLPNLLSYYDNVISINDKDIPINYSLSEVIRYVSPPLRSGSYITFGVTKIQAITGVLKIRIDGVVEPVEYYEVRMTLDGEALTFPTGKGGEFYIENVKAGKHKASFTYMEKTCLFDIIIPESDEMIIDLGEIICEDIR
jgi:outer membrane usher protein